MRLRFLFLMLVLVPVTGTLGQRPLEVRRTSDIAIRLEKKGNRELKLALTSSDEIKIKVSTRKRVNFRVLDPNGLVLHENVAMAKPVEWSKPITADGVYALVVENVDPWLSTDVVIQVILRRPRFTYGSGVAGSSQDRTVLTSRSQDVLTDGRVQIVTGAPRKYPYNLEKGDTLVVDLKGLVGPVPFVEISNAQKELLYAALPERRRAKVTIPILETGAHELLLYSKFLTNTPLVPMYDSIRVERIAPTRYAPAVVVPVDSATLPKPVVYDTIPELIMDSVFFVGAVRDYVHPSRISVPIPVSQPENIIFWTVLFGAGKDFDKSYRQLGELVEKEYASSGTSDPLVAYGLGLLKSLPGHGNTDVRFSPSEEIQSALDAEVRPNYGRILKTPDIPGLVFENFSKSVGHPVFLKVAVFRRAARPQE